MQWPLAMAEEVILQYQYQADINDLENTEPNHQAGLRDLTCKIEQLQQTIEANDNNPMDAISHLEYKLNQLGITLSPPMPEKPIGEVLNKYTNTLCNAQKCLLKAHYYKISQY